MGYIEADTAVVYGRIVEGFKIPFREDLYFETLFVPGFSDGHMHPQVVDVGLVPGVKWRDSYEWLRGRRLRVDEARVRSDLGLAARLARIVFARSLLEGVTFVAVTGRFAANVRGWLSLPVRPRVVFMPTVIDRRGWPSIESIGEEVERLRIPLSDGLARVGVFVHSLGTTSSRSLLESLRIAAEYGGVFGLHLSEGRAESYLLEKSIDGGPRPARIVAVHCIDDGPPRGVSCIACPASNLVLYGRTRGSLDGVDGFGSDWPLLLGSVARHLPVFLRVYRGRLEEVLERATVGGYRAYMVDYSGDFVGYDEELGRVLEGGVLPRWVFVAGEPVVVEGVLRGVSVSYWDVLRANRELVEEAIEKYRVDGFE